MHEEHVQKCGSGEISLFVAPIHRSVIKYWRHFRSIFFFVLTCDANQVNSLREIQAIKRLSPHPNIILLEEVLFDPPSGRLALVFELLEGNLYELMKGKLSLANNDSNFLLLPPLQFTRTNNCHLNRSPPTLR